MVVMWDDAQAAVKAEWTGIWTAEKKALERVCCTAAERVEWLEV